MSGLRDVHREIDETTLIRLVDLFEQSFECYADNTAFINMHKPLIFLS